MAHGPVVRDHDVRVNRKMRRGALRSALTDAFASGKLAVVEDLAFDEPKTKRAVEILDALDVDGRVLLVLAEPTQSGAIEKSFRNLEVVITAAAIDPLEGDRAPASPGEPTEGGEGS